MRHPSLSVLLICGLLAACGSSDDEDSTNEDAATAPAPTPAEPVDAYDAENRAFLAENATAPGVTVTRSGLQYRVLESGSGPQPGAADIVTVHYRGRLIDGSEFDSSYERGQPLQLTPADVIPGWREMLQLMQVGSRVEVFIPASLAYGSEARGDRIPANSTLIFEMELLDVQSAEDRKKALLGPQTAFMSAYAEREGVTVTQSGLMYRVVKKGPGGVSPERTSVVTVHYVGTLVDGNEFDSSRRRGEPVSFPLDRVIPGWTEGLQLMQVGDIYEFVIPHELGYGENGAGGAIPPYATLLFEVELLESKTPEEAEAAAEIAFAEYRAEQQEYLDKNGTREDVTTRTSGLQMRWLERGSEDAAVPGAESSVRVHYTGQLVNGEIFDSSRARGEPASFPVGAVIPGWTEALQQMRVGDRVELVIPYGLGYGERGSRTIPPFATLIFDVELLAVE